MLKLIVVVAAFFGGLLVPPQFYPQLTKVAFHLAGFGFSYSLLIAIGIAGGAMTLQTSKG